MPEVRIIIPQELDRGLDALVKAGFAGNKAELARIALSHLLSSLPMQIPRGYDLENAFSPDGRVFQLEYAHENVKHGGTIVGVCCSEGVVLAKEVRIKEIREKNPFVVIPNPFLKVFKISECVSMIQCGLLTDGYFVVDEALKQAKSLSKEEPVDVEKLAEKLILFMQSFGLRKDARPLGTAFLLGGLDPLNKPRLFHLEGSGRAFECKAHAIGLGEKESIEILKKRYKYKLSLEKAAALTVEATLRKTVDIENLLVATIDRKTKRFKELTPEEKERIVEKIRHRH
jgi:20S proteasome alpha/beta subunit